MISLFVLEQNFTMARRLRSLDFACVWWILGISISATRYELGEKCASVPKTRRWKCGLRDARRQRHVRWNGAFREADSQ